MERVGYRGHLLSSSGFAEVGESRLANVEAFLAYSKSKRTVAELLAHIEEIGRQYRDASEDEEHADYLKVMTIHRSKGLQWPVVFIPDCNDGILPPKKCENVEEERRLLYVAITRTMETLHLLVNKEVGV